VADYRDEREMAERERRRARVEKIHKRLGPLGMSAFSVREFISLLRLLNDKAHDEDIVVLEGVIKRNHSRQARIDKFLAEMQDQK